MFHDRRVDNKINNIQERAVRHTEILLNLKKLLEKDKLSGKPTFADECNLQNQKSIESVVYYRNF